MTAAWDALVAYALTTALRTLSRDDFDGLNNLFQIPFALPWFLIPLGGLWSHATDAWIIAGYGWFNGVILLLFFEPWLSRVQRGSPDQRSGPTSDAQ
jgi:hypothetical protein